MLVHLKQALHVEGKTYHLGVQDIPEETLKHPHFHKFMAAGLVTEADAPPSIVENAQQRGARLAEKLHVSKAKAEIAPKVEEEFSGEPSFEEDTSPKKSKHKGK